MEGTYLALFLYSHPIPRPDGFIEDTEERRIPPTNPPQNAPSPTGSNWPSYSSAAASTPSSSPIPMADTIPTKAA